MNKPLILYTALTKAVDNYNARKLYSRSKLADDLGFLGENAAIQFSNALSPTNHDKTLNDERKCILMHTLEYEDLIVYFTHYMKQFGLRPVSVRRAESSITQMHQVTDDAMIAGSTAFQTTKRSLRDKTLTSDQLKAIIEESKAAEELYAEVRLLAQARLSMMEVK